MTNPIAQRSPALPTDARVYRRIGPFDSQTLPSALTREHRLKAGAWGILRVQSGSVVFVWDDQEGGTCALAAGDAIIVPPQVPHHLDIQGDFRLEIEFLRLP